MENHFSLIECLWAYQPHSRAAYSARSSWPIQNELEGVFTNFVFHFALFWHFCHIGFFPMVCLTFVFVGFFVSHLFVFIFMFCFSLRKRDNMHSWVGREVRRNWEELWEGKP